LIQKAPTASKRVLLISLNRFEQPFPVFPLGLAYLRAALEREGHTTRVHDCLIDGTDPQAPIREFHPDLVGISIRNVDNVQMNAPVGFVSDCVEMVQAVRAATDCPVILGGAGFSIFPRQFMARTGADFGIQGEGEISFINLLRQLDGGGELQSISGLLWKNEGEDIRFNPPEHPNTCSIPIPVEDPDWVAAYLERGTMLNLQTQRGCALKCCFCTYPVIEGRCYRRREPEEIVEEMRSYQRLGAKYVFIVDSVFNTSRSHVTRICEAILQADLHLSWGCFMSPHGLSLQLLQLARKAGLTHIEFGSDSFCDSVLKRYGKHFSFADIEASTQMAQEAGIYHAHFLIIGGPGETAATLETTIQNGNRLSDSIIFAFPGMRIYPGTPVWQELIASGELKPEQDLLQPTFYLSSETPESMVRHVLEQVGAARENWITSGSGTAFGALTQKLRRKGKVGPLWEFFGLARRMQR